MCSIWIHFLTCGHGDTEYFPPEDCVTENCKNQYSKERNVPCHECIRTGKWRIVDTGTERYAIEKGREMSPVKIDGR
ncbi:hypothetical protein TWF481_000500 [Arthrobotrys musiformis]|uniref:Uncharacterized protein n=1 Tax=Arthrobotrys musiformis TaxID=47236 RepID=A0AAV9WPC0_9PEZI